MDLRHRFNDRSFLIRLGMLCLLVASALNWFMQPVGGLARDLSDAAMGAFFGLSIGLNLQAVRLSRQRRCDGKS